MHTYISMEKNIHLCIFINTVLHVIQKDNFHTYERLYLWGKFCKWSMMLFKMLYNLNYALFANLVTAMKPVLRKYLMMWNVRRLWAPWSPPLYSGLRPQTGKSRDSSEKLWNCRVLSCPTAWCLLFTIKCPQIPIKIQVEHLTLPSLSSLRWFQINRNSRMN